MLNLKLSIFIALAASALCLPTSIQAQTPLAAKLQAPLTATWQGQELGTVLQRIADTQHITLWIDRRVDRQRLIDAQLNAVPLSQALDQILDGTGLGWSKWDEILYTGPREAAHEMATLMAIARKSLDKLAASRRLNWMNAEATNWSRLSVPREILNDWLTSNGIILKNSQALSYDLWDAADLPPLPLIDRVSLVLLGFDKSFQISTSGTSVEIVPIHRPVLITEHYEPGRRMRELLAAFHDDTTVVLNRQGNSVAITGRWEDQQRAQELIIGSQTNHLSPAKAGVIQQRLFSLKLENQRVDKVIEQLAGQLGLAVNWQSDALAQREQLTSCEVQNGTLEQLLEAVLAPVGLRFSLDGSRLTILPR